MFLRYAFHDNKQNGDRRKTEVKGDSEGLANS